MRPRPILIALKRGDYLIAISESKNALLIIASAINVCFNSFLNRNKCKGGVS